LLVFFSAISSLSGIMSATVELCKNIGGRKEEGREEGKEESKVGRLKGKERRKEGRIGEREERGREGKEGAGFSPPVVTPSCCHTAINLGLCL
jgi:hypothetical protein